MRVRMSCSVSRRCAGEIEEAEEGGALVAGEDVAPQLLLLGERPFLIDALDAQRPRGARVAGADALALEIDLAGSRGVDAGDELDQRRLAGAVVADQRDDLAVVDLQVDVPEDLDMAEGLLHALHLQEGDRGIHR